MGQHRGLLTPEERARIAELQDLLIDRFVEHRDAVADGKDERVKTLEAGAAGSDRVVETQIAAASGQRYVLDYVLRQESGGWKVVDVLVDGAISRVAAQRSEMRSMLADSGGAGLLVGLRPDLSGGILR